LARLLAQLLRHPPRDQSGNARGDGGRHHERAHLARCRIGPVPTSSAHGSPSKNGQRVGWEQEPEVREHLLHRPIEDVEHLAPHLEGAKNLVGDSEPLRQISREVLTGRVPVRIGRRGSLLGLLWLRGLLLRLLRRWCRWRQRRSATCCGCLGSRRKEDDGQSCHATRGDQRLIACLERILAGRTSARHALSIRRAGSLGQRGQFCHGFDSLRDLPGRTKSTRHTRSCDAEDDSDRVHEHAEDGVEVELPDARVHLRVV